jgi:hypothetical protein
VQFLIKVSRKIYVSFILSQKRGQSQIPQVKSLQHATYKHSPFELFNCKIEYLFNQPSGFDDEKDDKGADYHTIVSTIENP